ncbi:hypothetical protein BJF88_09445 [Cellulosimicrobium sp. CUA-896]|nr:hypothetical protein BJF88_09445 [Cellulosimicrobium sp. CUA-896]
MLSPGECLPPMTGSGKHIVTPSSASTTPITPLIFTTTWLVTGTPVSSWTALMVHAAAWSMSSTPPEPISNAELNIALRWGEDMEPFGSLHAGSGTRESRGMDTTSMRVRSPDTCASSVVSDRMPPSSPAMAAFSASR